MAPRIRTELQLTSSKDEAIKAILDALPEDAVVRAEDDGVGRFAGERTVVVVDDAEDRLMMFQGTWGSIKNRLEDPQLDVKFSKGSEGALVKLKRDKQKKTTALTHASDFLSRGVTVAAVIVAYHYFRNLPVDYMQTALLGLAGAVAWTLVAHFMPKKQDAGLHGLVHDALEPLTADYEDDEDEEEDEDQGEDQEEDEEGADEDEDEKDD